MCTLADFAHLEIPGPWEYWLQSELEWWHHDYLPIVAGSTVLDVGAGCGETAQFYLHHGAAHVVCVEGHPSALRHLRRNFGDDPRVTIVAAAIDRIKIDIEGAEADMDLEIHFPWRWETRREVGDIKQTRLVRL